MSIYGGTSLKKIHNSNDSCTVHGNTHKPKISCIIYNMLAFLTIDFKLFEETDTK